MKETQRIGSYLLSTHSDLLSRRRRGMVRNLAKRRMRPPKTVVPDFRGQWVRLPPVSLDRVVFPTAACKAVVAKQAGWTTRGSIPSRPIQYGPFF